MALFTAVFLFVLVASVVVRLWLFRRQVGHIRAHYDRVPEAFAEDISLADHQLAGDYNCAKLRFGRFELGWETLWLLLWTLGGGISLIDGWWLQQELPPLLTGVLVVATLILASSILNLPFDYYHTFVIEERFGFNKTTLATWLTDMLKSTLLVALLGTPLLAAILWLMSFAGNLWWLYAWLLWMSFNLLMIWAYPAFIAPLFNTFSQLQDESLRSRIEALLQRCGFHSQGVFVVDGSRRSAHGNAYFSGFGRNKRIVFYDTLLKTLSVDEVEAVLAHELGHYKRHHIRKMLLMSSTLSFVAFALLAWLMESAWFYHALGVERVATHNALLLFVLVLPIFAYFVSPLFSALSRKHEFEADEFAHANSDYRALISALVNLYRDNASTLTPDPVHSVFYDSHPPASIRINHLLALADGGARSGG